MISSTAPKPFVFVLMPFSDDFRDVYELGIKPACEAAGTYCDRVDQQIYQESMLQRITNQISKADIIVADLSNKNPNVFYETGYAHALNKSVILLTNNAADIPFDLKHHLHIVYGQSISKLKAELERFVAHYVANPGEKQSVPAATLEFYANGNPISDGTEIEVIAIDTSLNFHLDVRNPARAGFLTSKCKTFVVASEMFKELTKSAFATKLPDGKFMTELPNISNLFPEGWTALRFQLARPRGNPFSDGERIPLTVRLYTEVGPRDIEFIAVTKVVEPTKKFTVG